MASIEDMAREFIRAMKSGGKPTYHIRSKEHLQLFLGVLAREGIKVAVWCLDKLPPDVREIVRTIFLSTAGGAALGAAAGAIVGGEPGAKVGAIVGAGVGAIAGVVAVSVVIKAGPRGFDISPDTGECTPA